MDKSGGRGSILRGWDTALKIPALFLLMMAVAFVREPLLLPLLPLIALACFLSSGLSFHSLLKVLRIPLFLVLFVALFMALFSGREVMLALGPLAIRKEGVLLALGILVRVASVMTIGSVMTGTTPLAGLSEALRRMRIPPMMVDIGVLTGRYIMVIGEDHRQMAISRRLRGYRPGISFMKTLRVVVPTTASLLIRGFGRSERVFSAMRMRGYGKGTRVADTARRAFTVRDVCLTVGTTGAAVALLVLEAV
ncbi:MAG: cobalt ECF transporter T component CbiQ [Candidatus Fermentibacteraceae bacterium]|nr:cobalt ECF transporter T component CbiQ [Candidatus Fermentibacteraceae bacterium]MBN2607929.1 cobalt ECF transporter T component CbiQ [Candidatus Fermentibacteraceae bacterium]